MMPFMERFTLKVELPADAAAAVTIVQQLVAAGHQAVLAGGCVRDLLLGQAPKDYDVATNALPPQIVALFRATREVGAQFGVVLAKQRGRWVEVATFRSDGTYHDGRRPSSVTPTDAAHDAQRRDFTVNGMFLDPLTREVLDYVGGRADLAARVLRAIGDPEQRFSEDYLRMLRAVRFAARLDFPIEPRTLTAIQTRAANLRQIAAERVREELQMMLGAPARGRAWHWLGICALRPHLWPGAAWTAAQAQRAQVLLERLPAEAPFELALAILVADYDAARLERLARDLTLSNEQANTVAWLVEHQCDLDEPAAPTLATLKRLRAHPAFEALHDWAAARYADAADAVQRKAALAARLSAIASDRVQPPPFVRGDDLLARGLRPGPVFRELLEALYTRQLDEELNTRTAALTALDALLAERNA